MNVLNLFILSINFAYSGLIIQTKPTTPSVPAKHTDSMSSTTSTIPAARIENGCKILMKVGACPGMDKIARDQYGPTLLKTASLLDTKIDKAECLIAGARFAVISRTDIYKTQTTQIFFDSILLDTKISSSTCKTNS